MRRNNYKGQDTNNAIDTVYELASIAKVVVGCTLIAGSVIGALTGFGLSFTALSPLIAGGIVGAILPGLVLAAVAVVCYYKRDEISKLKEEDGIVAKRVIEALIPFFSTFALASIAIGVTVAATANTVFSGVMSGALSATFVGGVIGAVALPIGIITGAITVVMFAGNLLEHVMPADLVDGPNVNSLNSQRGKFPS